MTSVKDWDVEAAPSTSEAAPSTSEAAPSTLEAAPSFVIVAPKGWFVAVAGSVTLVTGVMAVISVNFQNRQIVQICRGTIEDCPEESFVQPFWQTFTMFVGEMMCLLIYWIDRHVRNRRGRKLMTIEFPTSTASFMKKRMPVWWWMIPALLDLIGTVLVNVAFNKSYASTIQMLRNTMLILTSFFSIVMLKKPLRLHEVVGILVITFGMVVAGIRAIRTPDESALKDPSQAWIGVLCTLIGTVFSAIQIILEEWYFKKATMPPMLSMGLQGVFGVLFNGIALIIVHYSDMYNLSHGMHQISRSLRLALGNLWYLLVVWLFNAGSICTTKLGSGLLRASIYSLRAPLVWLVELSAGWQSYAVDQLLALFLVAAGFFMYAMIIPYVTRRRTPKTFKLLRYQIPCFCTHSVLSDAEQDPILQTIAKEVTSTPTPI